MYIVIISLFVLNVKLYLEQEVLLPEGRFYLCRVAGNTVLSHVAGDVQ